MWLVFAFLSAFFAGMTSVLAKCGIQKTDSTVATAIRKGVVLVMAWAMVFVAGKQKTIRRMEKKEFAFICLSGLATGGSWLCYYRALQDGPASVVVPVDKLSILITVAFSYFLFGEKLRKKPAVGLAMITTGTVLMIV